MRRHTLIAVLMALLLGGGMTPDAHAWGKHNSPKAAAKASKNNGAFGINLKNKKQKKVKGYYRSTLTGKRVY